MRPAAFFALLLAVGRAFAAAPDLLHWRFDGAGALVDDASGQGRTGQLHGVAQGFPAPCGKAAALVGGADRCAVAGPGGEPMAGRREFTLALWLRLDPASAPGLLLGAGGGPLVLRVGGEGGAETLVLELSSDAGAVALVAGPGALSGRWRHLAVSWRSGAAPALFLDGAAVRWASGAPAPLGGALSGKGTFAVGGLMESGPLAGVVAAVADVRLWSRALDATALREVFAEGNPDGFP